MNRRAFIKGLFGAAAAVATPKIFVDMGAAWIKRGDLYEARYLDFISLEHERMWRLHAKNLEQMMFSDGTGMLGRLQDHVEDHARIMGVS